MSPAARLSVQSFSYNNIDINNQKLATRTLTQMAKKDWTDKDVSNWIEKV